MYILTTIPNESESIAAVGPFVTAGEARIWGEQYWGHRVWVIVGLMDPDSEIGRREVPSS